MSPNKCVYYSVFEPTYRWNKQKILRPSSLFFSILSGNINFSGTCSVKQTNKKPSKFGKNFWEENFYMISGNHVKSGNYDNYKYKLWSQIPGVDGRVKYMMIHMLDKKWSMGKTCCHCPSTGNCFQLFPVVF